MEKGSTVWLAYANSELKKAFPKAKGGDQASYEGGIFQFRNHSKRWHFQGWLEGEDPKKTIVDVIQ